MPIVYTVDDQQGVIIVSPVGEVEPDEWARAERSMRAVPQFRPGMNLVVHLNPPEKLTPDCIDLLLKLSARERLTDPAVSPPRWALVGRGELHHDTASRLTALCAKGRVHVRVTETLDEGRRWASEH